MMRLVAVVVTALSLVLLAPPLSTADAEVTNLQAPRIAGEAVYGDTLRAGPGRWDTDVTVTYRWLRDGSLVPGATARTYELGVHDLGHRMSVRVTATADGGTGRATSAETAGVRRAELTNRQRPTVRGTQRFTRTVRATPGRWSTTPDRVRYQWLRAGRPIRGETGRRHAMAPQDVGRLLRVRVTAYAEGHRPARVLSARTGPVRHRVDVRRAVTYSVETRGAITSSLRTFRRQAQQTFDDPRGWRAAGVSFRRVARGGSFTLVLAAASSVPSFSPVCSSQYSCRVGRYVIINQERWTHATPPWNAAGGSLRDYRHMVVDHETGHWLGLGHAGCPRAGRPAPVMMQQSKGLGGCRFNPFPVAGELARVGG